MEDNYKDNFTCEEGTYRTLHYQARRSQAGEPAGHLSTRDLSAGTTAAPQRHDCVHQSEAHAVLVTDDPVGTSIFCVETIISPAPTKIIFPLWETPIFFLPSALILRL